MVAAMFFDEGRKADSNTRKQRRKDPLRRNFWNERSVAGLKSVSTTVLRKKTTASAIPKTIEDIPLTFSIESSWRIK